MISSIALAEKEQGRELSEEEAFRYVQKELKQTKDTLAQTPAHRNDLLEETKRKIEIIESYLPVPMSEEEIIAAIDKIMADKGIDASGKNRGIIIKEMLSTYAGKTDGKSVNKVLASKMK